MLFITADKGFGGDDLQTVIGTGQVDGANGHFQRAVGLESAQRRGGLGAAEPATQCHADALVWPGRGQFGAIDWLGAIDALRQADGRPGRAVGTNIAALASGTDTIRNAATVSAAGGLIFSSTPGSVVHLFCPLAGTWYVDTINGTWTVQ